MVSAAPDVALEFVRRVLRYSRTANPAQPPQLLVDIRPGAWEPSTPLQRTTSLTGGTGTGELTPVAAALRQAGVTLLAVLDDAALPGAREAAARAGIPLLDPVGPTVSTTARVVAGTGGALLLSGPDAGFAALYQAEASRQGLEILLPEPQVGERLGQAIQLVQRGQLAQARTLALETALAAVRRTGPPGPAAAIVLASSALAVVLRPCDFTEPAVDALDQLARTAASLAGA